MLKILWEMGEIAPEEQFLLLSTIFYNLMLDFYVKTGIRFSLRDKRLFEITEVEITRVDCIWLVNTGSPKELVKEYINIVINTPLHVFNFGNHFFTRKTSCFTEFYH